MTLSLKPRRSWRLPWKTATFLLVLRCFVVTAQAATAVDEAYYSSLYPYYAEFCADSQILKKPGFGADIRGGIGGHSVLYLNGVCRDPSENYPTIVMCRPDTPAVRQGVGLSVNAHFKNAYWVATEGRDFFFHGDLDRTKRLTRDDYRKVQARAKDMGIYSGVVFHDEVFDDKPDDMSREDYKYEVSIGTDYAVELARDRYCTRVPTSVDQMKKIIVFLNSVNDIYKSGEKDFEWNVLENNCSHMTHNALAAAGFWPPWETDRFILISAFDFPVPKNEFVNLARRLNDIPTDDLIGLYRDPEVRKALDENWLPLEPGALVEKGDVFPDNDVYDTDLSLIFYHWPIYNIYQIRFDEMFSEPRYFDVRANLRYFSDLYKNVLADRKPVEGYLVPHRDVTRANKIAPLRVAVSDPDDFRRFYSAFYAYVAREKATIDGQIAVLQSKR